MPKTPEQWIAENKLFHAYLAACVARGSLTREQAAALARRHDSGRLAEERKQRVQEWGRKVRTVWRMFR